MSPKGQRPVLVLPLVWSLVRRRYCCNFMELHVVFDSPRLHQKNMSNINRLHEFIDIVQEMRKDDFCWYLRISRQRYHLCTLASAVFRRIIERRACGQWNNRIPPHYPYFHAQALGAAQISSCA